MTVGLTQYSPAGGCGCKMPQATLATVLSGIQAVPPTWAGVRVGLAEPDDAAVFDLGDLAGQSLVLTCDFQTPIVDDPTDWGRIAAINALSDVYAMGGRPILALNLLCWPSDLDPTLMHRVLAGGSDAVHAAGAVLVGGHSITDPVPKYGLAVVGHVSPHQLLRKNGAQAGDRLILTKPLGVGVIGTAIKRGRASPAQVQAAIDVMTRSNASASQVAVAAQLRGATDVSGFGLLGHLHEMAEGSGLSAELWAPNVPRLDAVASLIASDCAPDGSRRTLRDALDQNWFCPGGLPFAEQLLLADAQTSGGLLLAAAPGIAADVVAALRAGGDSAAAEIGEFRTGEPGVITSRADQPHGGH